MANLTEERDRYNGLIRVLQEALQEAAEVLGPNVRSSSKERRFIIEHPYQIYEYLCDLLDEALEARSRLE
ncbi:MAG: hypothetical protein ACLQAT_10810 [Candidatus Binataceae bacterium]